MTGVVETGPVPGGQVLFGGLAGYLVSDAVSSALWSDSVLGYQPGRNEGGQSANLQHCVHSTYDGIHVILRNALVSNPHSRPTGDGERDAVDFPELTTGFQRENPRFNV